MSPSDFASNNINSVAELRLVCSVKKKEYSMTHTEKVDVLIVGGGPVGLFFAYQVCYYLSLQEKQI